MSRTTRQTFRYTCQGCGAVNTATCKRCGLLYRFDPILAPGEKMVKRSLHFGDRQWALLAVRARLLGISSNELIRLACSDLLALPPSRLNS